MLRAILLVAALAACKGERLKWNAHAITKLTAGPFSVDIPPGWRDLSENSDPALAHLARRADPSAHMIVREDAANTDSNIALMWTDVARPINCKAFFAAFDQMGASTSGIDRATLAAMPIGADELCTFHMTDGDSVGTGHVRMHGSGYATLQCMHDKGGDGDNDTTCEALRAALARP
jgi:hypothetical protein